MILEISSWSFIFASVRQLLKLFYYMISLSELAAPSWELKISRSGDYMLNDFERNLLLLDCWALGF